ncbi:MAG: hypothetical protein SVY10_14690 [Thermodesulfobacteriota bacterium]|nr:hypothetical protein [Thermodesulfobacteriota bacterium]
MKNHTTSETLVGPEGNFGEILLAFSSSISLDWLYDNIQRINETSEFNTLIHLFPPLKEIFQRGLREDRHEFTRTLPHTFQTQAAYNRICSGCFPESGLNEDAIRDVYTLAHSVSSFSPLVMPVILWLHDIGRFEDKRRHNEKSAEMISEFHLLKNTGLSEEEALLIRKVIQYHLLIGTLYTGESSYMSFEPLIRDDEFKKILYSEQSIQLFLESLTLFTMIDVWGYHINDISPTMISNYFEIKDEMADIFQRGGDLDEIASGLKKKSRKHLDWRLMGYMMAFSKIGKKPHLTQDFYAGMIHGGFERYIEHEDIHVNWNSFKDMYLDRIDQVQFKYGLGVLIPLAYGGTGKKMHLTDETRVNPNLFHLLVNINKRISKEEDTNNRCIPGALWNVVFKGYPMWNQKTDFHQRLNEPGQIEEIIGKSHVDMDEKEGTNILSVDYSGYWKDTV